MLKKKLFQTTSLEKPSLSPEATQSDSMDLSTPEEFSRYFSNVNQESSNHFINQILEIQESFNNSLNEVNFLKPIEFVYNPTEYAKIPFELYFNKYCQSSKKLLFVGMNPGPFGMCQTGVPFGDTNWVKNWLCIEGPVTKPLKECPKRPIEGFNCTRKEQSGDRFWKFWSDLCHSPNIFFRNSFVYNYCPLAFMDKNGRNLTPAEIKDCKELESICDEFFLETVNLLQPEILVAVGRYIEKRTLKVFKDSNINVPILFMPHPSPRSVNNNNWPDKAKLFIETNNLMRFFQ